MVALRSVNPKEIPVEVNILFIGNSFIYYNDMPKTVEEMAIANGFKTHVESITYGGYSLIQYMTAGKAATQQVIDKLNERKWDYVVLQEQSSKPDTNRAEFLYSVSQLEQLISNHGAQLILYSTWSYRDGSEMLADTGHTYTEFYKSLTSAYKEAAETYTTLRAPVGTTFYNLTMEKPSINLLESDDFHPNATGSYIAALTFYTMIFGKETKNIFVPNEIAPNIVAIVREYVLETLETE